MKKFLENLLAKRKAELRVAEIRFDKSTDEAEVRALGETLSNLKKEIEDIEEQLKSLDDGGNGGNGGEGEGEGRSAEGGNGGNGGEGEGRSATPPVVSRSGVVNGNIMQTFIQQGTPQARSNENVFDSIEYREAFATYVRTGDAGAFAQIEQRAAADGMIITSDVGKIIPNTIMKEVIKELKVYGSLYNKVRKLNVRGGVEFPIEELVPEVKWITETTVSDNQSAPELKTSVSFGYHICEARIAQSLLSQITSLEMLESEIAKLLAEAFVKEFDRIILNGTGTGQPLGILNDTRVAADHKVKFTDAQITDWTEFRKRLFAKIPLAYRGQGVIVTTVATWETYFMTLKDANNRPLYTETYDAVNGTETCRFAGREVILVENDIIKDYDTAASGEAFAVYFKPNDYAINSQLQIGFKRYFNDDTNKWVNKGLTVMDGKLLDVNGVFVLTK